MLPSPDASWSPFHTAMYGWAAQARVDIASLAEIGFAVACLVVFLLAVIAVATSYRVVR